MTTAIMKNQPVNIRYDSFFTRALTLPLKVDICKQSRQQGGFRCLLINASVPSAARSSHPTKSIKSPDVPRYCSPGR